MNDSQQAIVWKAVLCGDSHPYVGLGHAFVDDNVQWSMFNEVLSGGYCSGVPPLPIPNREVKPACADGTAMQCGRVGGRHLFHKESPESEMIQGFLCLSNIVQVGILADALQSYNIRPPVLNIGVRIRIPIRNRRAPEAPGAPNIYAFSVKGAFFPSERGLFWENWSLRLENWSLRTKI